MAQQMIDETEETTENAEANAPKVQGDIDSKYRMIILAAQRSKQLQRGAKPRVDADPRKTKTTRIAMKELENGKVHFETLTELQFSTKQ
ncbi:MAG TPA: DNA-directed RNA polymerase subunit omega [Pyrinomonadaceae bacterium]|jgi:DNA-directed RNA polymerase subunit omega